MIAQKWKDISILITLSQVRTVPCFENSPSVCLSKYQVESEESERKGPH